MEYLFVGIDVAKDTLDVVVRRAGQNSPVKTFANDEKGIAALLKWLTKDPQAPIWACLEATGQYGELVTEQLSAHHHTVSVINPLRIKRYASAAGVRNQTDPVDAGLIASFGAHFQPRPWVPPSAAHKLLRGLSRRLADLQAMLQMERNRLAASKQLAQPLKDSLQAMISTLEQQIETIKAEMLSTLNQEPELKRQKKLLMSIPGVGELTAVRFLAELGDLRDFSSAKQLSAFLGLTPESKSSGTSVQTKPKLSKKGNAAVRQFLYMPAVVAKQFNPVIRNFCARLAGRQKCNMAIIGAAMHKLVCLMFGVVHSGLPFDPNFCLNSQVPS
jgi:transposase